MAVVSHVPAIPQRIILSSREETVEQPAARVTEDKVYVAVGKHVKESKSVLLWALQNSGGKRICIISVNQPAQMMPVAVLGTKFPASALKEQHVREYRKLERQFMQQVLDEYLAVCRQMGVQAEAQYIEMESIVKGILELISQCGIRKLVMGAAADKHYSRRMIDIKSRKALSVRLQAPASCDIWFICEGNLIYTRCLNCDSVSQHQKMAEKTQNIIHAEMKVPVKMIAAMILIVIEAVTLAVLVFQSVQYLISCKS